MGGILVGPAVAVSDRVTRSLSIPNRISRFEVMAILQAARAYILGLDLDEAKSWGLNRALFYAAAKKGWQRAKVTGAKRPKITEFEESRSLHDPVYVLGGEKAFRTRNFSKGLRFKFGSLIQGPSDFDFQVKRKLKGNWEQVWADAIRFVQGLHRRDLDIQSRFFNNVYKPRRDLFAAKWSNFGGERRKQDMNGLDYLRIEHRRVNDLFNQIESESKFSDRKKLFKEINSDLIMHAHIEEQVLYPFFSEREEYKKIIETSLDDHQEAKSLLQEIAETQDENEFDNLVSELVKAVRHHVKEEENIFFPKIMEVLSNQDLEVLGKNLEAAKQTPIEDTLAA